MLGDDDLRLGHDMPCNGHDLVGEYDSNVSVSGTVTPNLGWPPGTGTHLDGAHSDNHHELVAEVFRLLQQARFNRSLLCFSRVGMVIRLMSSVHRLISHGDAVAM